MEKPFKCAICELHFFSEQSEEACQKEFEKNFPEDIGKETDLVCEKCYKEFMEWHKENNNGR